MRLYISRSVTKGTSRHDIDNSVTLQLVDVYSGHDSDESPSLGLVD